MIYCFKFVSDDQFVRPINEAVRLQSKHSPVWYFRFSYEGDIGATNRSAAGNNLVNLIFL